MNLLKYTDMHAYQFQLLKALVKADDTKIESILADFKEFVRTILVKETWMRYTRVGELAPMLHDIEVDLKETGALVAKITFGDIHNIIELECSGIRLECSVYDLRDGTKFKRFAKGITRVIGSRFYRYTRFLWLW